MCPETSQRDIIKSIHGTSVFWVLCDSSWEACAERDPRGLYSKARNGEIENFAEFHFDSPRVGEVDLHLQTDRDSEDECFNQLLIAATDVLSDFSI